MGDLQTAPSKNVVAKVILPIVGIIALAVFVLSLVKDRAGQHVATNGHQEVKVGVVMPDFELKRFQGATESFLSLKKKVVLVNFWASWCEACMVEMPSIVALREKYKDQGFEVLGINMDENPDSVVPDLVKELKMSFPIYLGEGTQLPELFDLHAIPLSAVLDAKGTLLLLHTGERDWMAPEFQKQMEAWLSANR